MSPRFSAVLDRRSKPSTPPGASTSPPAARIQRRWWADTRVILGVVLLVVCTLVGARVVTMSSDEVEVWQVQRDLSAGAVLAPSDLQPIGVDPRLAELYASVDGVPAVPLSRDIRAGELLAVAAMVDSARRDVRWVTLPIEPLHAPADLAPGDRVDVWATADPARSFDTGRMAAPELVLPGALVASIDVDARGFAGDYGVVLEIAPDQAPAVLTAVRGALIDLVRVPYGDPSQGSAVTDAAQAGSGAANGSAR